MSQIEKTSLEALEDVLAEAIAFEQGAPMTEVHRDRDLVWRLTPGSASSNTAVRPRFSPRSAERRLDTIATRYARNGRGMGMWVSPFATPADLAERLRVRGLRLRKRFPAMGRDLANTVERVEAKVPLSIEPVTDCAPFRAEHPAIGRITTDFRRLELRRLEYLNRKRPRRWWHLVAWQDGDPLGSASLFIGSAHAMVFDVAVVERARNQSVGRALMSHVCRLARKEGAGSALLIATDLGAAMYRRVGFDEVGRIGFWYAARPHATRSNTARPRAAGTHARGGNQNKAGSR